VDLDYTAVNSKETIRNKDGINFRFAIPSWRTTKERLQVEACD
jgi:hypothetical protein